MAGWEKTSLGKVERVDTVSQVGGLPAEGENWGWIRVDFGWHSVHPSGPAQQMSWDMSDGGCGEEVGGQWLSTAR